MENKMYINGEWIKSASGATFESLNPATKEPVGSFQKGNKQDVKAAIDAAEDAFEGWRSMPAPARGEILFKIAEDLTRMQVNTNVDEADIGRVKEGQKAVFSVPAFPDLTFSASVNQIRNEPTVQQNVVTYNVVLDVDNKDLKLRPGMTANVRILLSEIGNTLLLPDQAFRFVPPVKSFPDKKLPKLTAIKPGQRRIWRLDSGDRISPVLVRRGVVGSGKAQVFSDELKPGDKIVVDAVATKKKRSRRGLRFGM